LSEIYVSVHHVQVIKMIQKVQWRIA